MITELTTIPLPIKTIQLGSPSDFSQRNIAMEFKNLKDHVKCFNTVVEFVKNNAGYYACVFSGSKAKSFHLLSELER